MRFQGYHDFYPFVRKIGYSNLGQPAEREQLRLKH